MDERLNAIGKRYASASDDELRYIAVTFDLASDAKPILERELARRGIRDLENFRQQLNRDEALRWEDLKRRLAKNERALGLYSRIAGAIFVLLFLAGAARLYFEGNDRGVPLMIFSVVVILLLWVHAYLLRRSWRAQAAYLVVTPAFKLRVSGDWHLVQSVDPEVRLLYSKELEVQVTASFMLMSAKPSDTERIATKLKESRLQAENKAVTKVNRRMTIAEPIVVPFSQGHRVAYFGHDSAGRQFRYLGLALPAKNINLYAESDTRSQGELEKVFNQLLNGLSF